MSIRSDRSRSRWVAPAAATVLLLGACSWVPLKPEAEQVRVRAEGDVSGCERLGKTHTRTLERVGPFPRRERKILEELEALARNEAVQMGGNSVAPLEGMLGGERDYGIYRCP